MTQGDLGSAATLVAVEELQRSEEAEKPSHQHDDCQTHFHSAIRVFDPSCGSGTAAPCYCTESVIRFCFADFLAAFLFPHIEPTCLCNSLCAVYVCRAHTCSGQFCIL